MHPGNRLRQARKDMDLTQAELAERTGYNQDRISNYENGRRPLRLVEMRVLARGLGCSVADLLEDSDNPERLDDAERRLLRAFRNSPPAAREFLIASAEAVSSPAEAEPAERRVA
jgi:transcriptional regulator with XRE-family HTH domain